MINKKWRIALIVLVLGVCGTILSTTDYFQDMGLRIPRNFEQCLKFGGKGEVLGDSHQGIGTGQRCVWMGINFKGPFINF